MYFATEEVLWLAFCYLILLVDEFVFKWAFSCFRLFLDESESIFSAKVWTAKIRSNASEAIHVRWIVWCTQRHTQASDFWLKLSHSTWCSSSVAKMFDKVFTYIGDFGWYQLYIFLLLGLPGYFLGYNVFAMTFLGFVPEHSCKVDRLKEFPTEIQQKIGMHNL